MSFIYETPLDTLIPFLKWRYINCGKRQDSTYKKNISKLTTLIGYRQLFGSKNIPKLSLLFSSSFVLRKITKSVNYSNNVSKRLETIDNTKIHLHNKLQGTSMEFGIYSCIVFPTPETTKDEWFNIQYGLSALGNIKKAYLNKKLIYVRFKELLGKKQQVRRAKHVLIKSMYKQTNELESGIREIEFKRMVIKTLVTLSVPKNLKTHTQYAIVYRKQRSRAHKTFNFRTK